MLLPGVSVSGRERTTDACSFWRLRCPSSFPSADALADALNASARISVSDHDTAVASKKPAKKLSKSE